MIHHFKRATRHLIFWSLISAAIALSAVRIVLIGVESYKSDLEKRISVLAGTPVKLGSLGANMRGISPELVLKDIGLASILTTEKPAIHLKEIRIGINLGAFLLNRDFLSASWVTLVGAQLSVIRKPDGQFVVEGLKASDSQPLWLLQGRQYMILQSKITLQDKLKGTPPMVLESVNLAVMNEGNHHRINALTNLPEQYGDNLKMVVDFDAAADQFSITNATAFVEGNNVKLHELVSAYLPLAIGITTGSADIQAWGHWQGANLVTIKAAATLRQAVFSRPGKSNFPIKQLDTQFNAQLNDQHWQIDINRFLLETDDPGNKTHKKWPDAILSIAGNKALDTGFKQLKLYAKQLDLAEAATLLGFFSPLSNEQMQLIGQSQIAGKLQDFSLYAEPIVKSFAVAGWFDAINIEPILSLPGIENVSGKLQGSDTFGVAELDSQDARFNYPLLFAKPLSVNKITGKVAWQQTETEWVLASQTVELECTAFQSESRVRVTVPKNAEPPFIDLQTAFSSDDLGQIAAYMPTQIMQESQKNWLTKAFVGGKVTQGKLLLYGKANAFPYNDGTGVFEAKLDLDNVELNYHPEWLHISGINGELNFDKNNILGAFTHGLIGKVGINKADLLISGLGIDELLSIKGEAQGEISQVLSVLQQSPLASQITPVTANTTITGTTQATLDLSIPLRKANEIKVNGEAKLDNAQLTVNRLDLDTSKIIGDLKFNNQGIYGSGLKALALGNPIQVNVAQTGQETLLEVDGKASVSAVDRLFNWPESPFAEGDSAYHLQLRIPGPSIGNNPLQITIKSALEGVTLQLPGSLAKTKAQEKPSTLTMSLSDELALPLAFDYNNELKAAINLNTRTRKINSGHILIGDGDAKQRRAQGIKLEVSREHLPLQEWLDLAATHQTDTTDLDISEIAIRSQSAFWKKTRLGMFDLTLQRDPTTWSGEIASTVAKGKFSLSAETKGVTPVILDMEMLNLSALKQIKIQNGTGSAEFKPLFNIRSKKTLWQSENLGQLVLETQRTSQGMTIKRLELDGDDEKLSLSGAWKSAGITSATSISGRIDMNKASRLFDKLNITKDLTETSGVIDFNLNWYAAPWQLALPNLRGTMAMNLKSGRILSIEPGFGRLLGILAVAQWLKRIQLDFTDIYSEGLTFNSIQGNFNLLNGKATTDNLVIDAVPAKITIMGDTDLSQQTVDHVIKVVPKSLDALPIAGTIVSRVAAMVGKTLTGKDQEGFFFGTQYLVKGKWDDVKISSLHENDGIIQKTWNSITDFPWMEQEQQE
jgi:uncharacterized protein (TIGR02099 family)